MMVVWVRVVNVRGNKKRQIRVKLTGATDAWMWIWRRDVKYNA